MKKLWVAVKHGAVRMVPVLVTGGIALIASPSFQHYVEKHPGVATFVPVVAWLLHAVNKARQPAA